MKMQLSELKTRLDPIIVEDEKLQLLLDDAIAFVETTCNRKFSLGDFPRQLAPIITKYVRYELEHDATVKSESIGGMSQTFTSKDELTNQLVNDLSYTGLRRVRFTPFGGR